LAGIYLHIPFCKQACNYCNFHFTTSLRYKEELLNALLTETGLQKRYLQDQPVNTIYIGGGTPSLLETAECARLLESIYASYPVDPQAEITLEANPDDISPQKLRAWKGLGINRLSIGIQSFFEEELRWMNRAHDARQAYACIEQSFAAGFTNFSIDLIYGSPLLTDKMWQENVQKAIDFGIPHLSCYALTVEEKTPLHKLIHQQQRQAVDPDKQAAQFLLLMQWLRAAGYEHYEVSNFAKPGFRSRHNSSYWRGEPYLGLGPSAHSFNGSERQWNIANNAQYIASIQSGQLAAEKETLSEKEKLNELIMISLRTQEGLDLEKIRSHWPQSATAIEKGLDKFLNSGLVRRKEQNVQLTDEGMLLADGIASDLFQ
jgi:oxygen-independent coproporphyrinogen-3 oxidase